MLNLSVLLEDSARRYPDRDAVVLGDTRLTYAQVNERANRVARRLVDRGVRPGDKVALSAPNIPAFPIVYYGILKAGAVVVPLNILLKRREIAYHLKDADAVAYVCFEGGEELPIGEEGYAGFREATTCRDFLLVTAVPDAVSPIEGVDTLDGALRDLPGDFESVTTEPTDTAVILYTSGTTGQPKGAELSHANVVTNALTVNRLFQSRPASDAHVLTLPMFHTFGATVQMHAGFAVAATLHLVPRFDAREVIGLMDREEITFFAGVPTMWWGLLGAIDDTVDVDRIAKNLRVGVSGGSALPVELHRNVEGRLGVNVLEGYGLSETSPVVTFSDPDRPPRVGSIGVPIWGVEVKLINDEWSDVTTVGEIGEIAIRGHNVMKGYYGRPEATAEAIRHGWFRTGDLARQDADGYFYIVDRAKDLIIRGGFNVYPREVEEVLLTHPSVSLVAVVGVPHESHGEEVKAYVVAEAGSSITGQDLVDWARAEMAGYKYPRIVEIVATLPMTATGKILKRELL